MAGRSQCLEQIMENQTRFDLNVAVENWRNELAAQPNLASDDRRELETHLRDAITGFQQRGLNDEESFWLARKRVGQPQQLVAEFEKADPAKVWRVRISWMCFAVWSLSIFDTLVFSLKLMMSPMKSGSFLDRINMPEILSLLTILVPLLAVIILSSGKINLEFLKSKFFRRSKFHLLIITFPIITAVTFLEFFAIKMYNSRIQVFAFDHSILTWRGIGVGLPYQLILTLLLIWFVPTQNRKTPKRA